MINDTKYRLLRTVEGSTEMHVPQRTERYYDMDMTHFYRTISS